MTSIGSSALSGPVVSWLDTSLQNPIPAKTSPLKWIPIPLVAVVGLGTTTTCESVLGVFQVFLTMALYTVRHALLSCKLSKCTQLASHIPASYGSDKLLAETRAMPRLAFRAALVSLVSLVSVKMGLDLYRSLTPEAGEGLASRKQGSCLSYLTQGVQRRISRCSHLMYRWMRRHPLLATALCGVTAVAIQQLHKYTSVKPNKPRPLLMLEAKPLQPIPDSNADHMDIFEADRNDDTWQISKYAQRSVDAIQSLEGTWTFFCMQTVVVTAIGAAFIRYGMKEMIRTAIDEVNRSRRSEFRQEHGEIIDALAVAEGKTLKFMGLTKQAGDETPIEFREREEAYITKIYALAMSFRNPDRDAEERTALIRHIEQFNTKALTLPEDIHEHWREHSYPTILQSYENGFVPYNS